MECNNKPACEKCGLVLKNESLELHLLKECNQSLFNCSRCDEELDNNTSLDDIVLCYDCAMDKAGY